VPEPVSTRDGALVTTASVPGVPEPRDCVVLRWVDGRFLRLQLDTKELERVGEFMAKLHRHAERFVAPPGFFRKRWDYGVPIFNGEINSRGTALHACIVDQDINPPKGEERRVQGFLRRCFSTDIEHQGKKVSACAGAPLRQRLGIRGMLYRDDISTRLGKRNRHAKSQTTAATCYNSNFAI
jgi:hypothetical protein